MVAYVCPIHVNMQQNYLNMQEKYVNMQNNYVNMQVKNLLRKPDFYMGNITNLRHNYENTRLAKYATIDYTSTQVSVFLAI